MNSGCSASNASGVCSADCRPTISCHHTSRPSVHGDVLAGAAHHEHVLDLGGAGTTASSMAGLSADGLAAPVAAVGGDDQLGVGVVDPGGAAASAENPPKTTECAAPIRAQASIATTASGIIGR